MTSFDRDSTTDDVLEGIDLAGRRVVVTGAASGLGFESSRALAAHGATVTVLARSEERATGAVESLRALVPGATFEAGVVDLSDLGDIERFAERFLAEHDAFDVLMNNAGVMASPFGRTADGFETQFGTNHLGHFALTARLAPALFAGDTPRVVMLSSAGHSRSDVDLEDPNFERTPYSPWVAYGRSKTANALFARELARRAGASVLSFSVHPGGIVTELGRHLDDELRNDMAEFAKERSMRFGDFGEDGEPLRMRFKSVPAGAATQVWGATEPTLSAHNGAYLADCGLGVLGANPSTNGYMAYLLDDDHAQRLWELSQQLVDIRFLDG
jgi:NAD(P)-dependent dehydrogenase (short-subunit alcohol dehydrogenase family)